MAHFAPFNNFNSSQQQQQQQQQSYDNYNFQQHQQPLNGQYHNYQSAAQIQNVHNVYYGYGNIQQPQQFQPSMGMPYGYQNVQQYQQPAFTTVNGNFEMPVFDYNSDGLFAGQSSQPSPQPGYLPAQQMGFQYQQNRTLTNEELDPVYDQQASQYIDEMAQSFWGNPSSQSSTLANGSSEALQSQVPSRTDSLPILPSEQQQDGSQSSSSVDLGDEVEITKVIPILDLTAEEEVAAPPVPEPVAQPLRRKSNPSWLKTSANIETAARRNSAELLIKAQTEKGFARLREQEERKKELRKKKERTQQASKEKSQKPRGKKRKSSDVNEDSSTSSPTKRICPSQEHAVEELSTSNSGSESRYTEDEMAELLQFADECDQDLAPVPQPRYSDEEVDELARLFFEEQEAEEVAQEAVNKISEEAPQEEGSEGSTELDQESEEMESGWEPSIEEDLFGDWDFLNAPSPE